MVAREAAIGRAQRCPPLGRLSRRFPAEPEARAAIKGETVSRTAGGKPASMSRVRFEPQPGSVLKAEFTMANSPREAPITGAFQVAPDRTAGTNHTSRYTIGLGAAGYASTRSKTPTSSPLALTGYG